MEEHAKHYNKGKDKRNIAGFISGYFFALIFILIGVSFIKEINSPKNTYIESQGIISVIESTPVKTKIMIAYVNDKGEKMGAYEEKEDNFILSKIKMGDTVKVYYNELNPQKVSVQDLTQGKETIYFSFGLSLLLFVVTTWLLILKLKEKRNKIAEDSSAIEL